MPSLGLAVEDLRDAEAVGDVAGRVLVVERVEERDAGLADARGSVDERELAEVRGTLVARQLSAHDVGALVRLARRRSCRPSRSACSPSTTSPSSASGCVERIVPSARRQSGVVKISSVGMFGTYSRPRAVRKSADIQRALASRPTVRSVPGPR